jgi:hypothetical protein
VTPSSSLIHSLMQQRDKQKETSDNPPTITKQYKLTMLSQLTRRMEPSRVFIRHFSSAPVVASTKRTRRSLHPIIVVRSMVCVIGKRVDTNTDLMSHIQISLLYCRQSTQQVGFKNSLLETVQEVPLEFD